MLKKTSSNLIMSITLLVGTIMLILYRKAECIKYYSLSISENMETALALGASAEFIVLIIFAAIVTILQIVGTTIRYYIIKNKSLPSS